MQKVGNSYSYFSKQLIFAVLGIFAIVKEPYRLKRVITFLDPWKDATGDGWQVIQSLYAIGSGGLFGAGLR